MVGQKRKGVKGFLRQYVVENFFPFLNPPKKIPGLRLSDGTT
jgi:hypothetical protein